MSSCQRAEGFERVYKLSCALSVLDTGSDRCLARWQGGTLLLFILETVRGGKNYFA